MIQLLLTLQLEGFVYPRPFPQAAGDKTLSIVKTLLPWVCLRLLHPTSGQLSVFEGSVLDEPVSKSR